MLEYFQHYPEIDLFVSRLNAQLLRFFSYRPDPFGEVKNAFSVSWEDEKLYFPPFACRNKILQKISADKATSIKQLELPRNMKETHPLWCRLGIMGFMVSGKGI